MDHRTKVLKKNERQMIEKKFKKLLCILGLSGSYKMTLLFYLTVIKMTKKSSNNNA